MNYKYSIPNTYVNYIFKKKIGMKQSISALKIKVYEKRQRIICDCLPQL